MRMAQSVRGYGADWARKAENAREWASRTATETGAFIRRNTPSERAKRKEDRNKRKITERWEHIVHSEIERVVEEQEEFARFRHRIPREGSEDHMRIVDFAIRDLEHKIQSHTTDSLSKSHSGWHWDTIASRKRGERAVALGERRAALQAYFENLYITPQEAFPETGKGFADDVRSKLVTDARKRGKAIRGPDQEDAREATSHPESNRSHEERAALREVFGEDVYVDEATEPRGVEARRQSEGLQSRRGGQHEERHLFEARARGALHRAEAILEVAERAEEKLRECTRDLNEARRAFVNDPDQERQKRERLQELVGTSSRQGEIAKVDAAKSKKQRDPRLVEAFGKLVREKEELERWLSMNGSNGENRIALLEQKLTAAEEDVRRALQGTARSVDELRAQVEVLRTDVQTTSRLAEEAGGSTRAFHAAAGGEQPPPPPESSEGRRRAHFEQELRELEDNMVTIMVSYERVDFSPFNQTLNQLEKYIEATPSPDDPPGEVTRSMSKMEIAALFRSVCVASWKASERRLERDGNLVPDEAVYIDQRRVDRLFEYQHEAFSVNDFLLRVIEIGCDEVMERSRGSNNPQSFRQAASAERLRNAIAVDRT